MSAIDIHREFLGRAFETLSDDMIQLVDNIIAMDPTFIVCITARLEEHIALLTGSRYAFLVSVLETSLKKALFSFSKFIVSLCQMSVIFVIELYFLCYYLNNYYSCVSRNKSRILRKQR